MKSLAEPSNPVLLTLSTAVGLSLLYIIGTICHRLWFHKLAGQSGPLLARLSGIPNWYHAAKGDRHEWLYSLHSRYGSTVRFAPDSVSFDTVAAVDCIYKSRKSNVVKSHWYQCVRDSAGGFESTFTARQKPRHAVKRRLLSHAFSERALRDYEPRIRTLIGTWLDCLEVEREKEASELNLGDWCNYLIFDILGDLAYGSAFGLTTNTEDRSIVGLIPKATGGWYSLGYHPLAKWMSYVLYKTPLGPWVGGSSFQDNIRFRNVCLSKLKERRQRSQNAEKGTVEMKMEMEMEMEKEDKKDMFEHLLKGRDPETGEGYSIGDLACESVLLMVAGSQSTSGGLAATFFYLAHQPAKLSKLRDEIHAAFATEDAIRYDPGGQLANLPYLRACIDESLRLSPPTPGHLPREIVDDQGLTIDGRWFPANANVGVSPYAIHRNKLYYSDPLEFLPERWLGDKEATKTLASAFSPFSGGATGCIGQQLAMMEMCLAIAKLLWRFDLVAQSAESKDGPVEFHMKDCFVGEGVGPRVRLVSCPP